MAPATAERPNTLVPLDERFLDLLPAAVYVCEASGVIQHFNRKAAELWGREPRCGDSHERFCGAFRLFHPDGTYMAHAATPMAEALQTGRPQRNREAYIERPDGSRVVVLVNIDPIFGPDGTVLGAVNVFQDITARKRSEEEAARLARAVEESERRFRQMAERIDDVFWMYEVGEPGRMSYVSPAYARIYGQELDCTAREPLAFLDAVHPEDRPRVIAAMERLLAGAPTAEEYRIIRPDGAVRWIWDRGFPIEDASGRVVRLTGIAEDITDKRTAEEALRDADRRKDEFLATLAHELRNPLAPIRNAIEVLALTGPHAASVEQVRALMERQVRHMVRLVDDLLDVARITRGSIELRKERVELSRILASAVETSRPVLEARRHSLEVSEPSEELLLEVDRTRLAQVLSNLLNNAAKFTPEGGRIELVSAREGASVVIRVRDDGAGLAPGEEERIFGLFVQAHDRPHTGGGLGIGLTLARSLVEMHGGTLRAKSEGPGRGSELVVRLPFDPTLQRSPRPEAPAASAERSRPGRTLRVLIIDDTVDSADSLGEVIELLGHTVQVAHGGEPGMELAGWFAPDLVFLDLGMPGLDGYEVARRLKSAPEPQRPKVVAMTGWGTEKDRQRTGAAGFDLHLVKPLALEAVEELLTAGAR